MSVPPPASSTADASTMLRIFRRRRASGERTCTSGLDGPDAGGAAGLGRPAAELPARGGGISLRLDEPVALDSPEAPARLPNRDEGSAWTAGPRSSISC